MVPPASLATAVVILAATAEAFALPSQTCALAFRAPIARTHALSARVYGRQMTSLSSMFAGEDDSVSASETTVADVVGSSDSGSTEAAGEGEVAEEPLSEVEMARIEKLKEIERLRAKEKFITEKTGEYECTQCSFVYKPNAGGQGALPGTNFEDLPSTWSCPVCKAPKDTFIAQTRTIAGFEDNLKYGLGANTLTGGQKNLLIFGSLIAFFVLFIAGYALE